MNRGLVTCLCALALAAYGAKANAQAPTVSLSLNLHYLKPNVPSAGGTFNLVAKTNSANGIAAIDAILSNINSAGVTFGATLNELTGITPVLAGPPVEVLYGQDTSAAGVVLHIGGGAGTPGNIPTDPLRNTATWNNSAVIFSGTFGATRPAFTTKGANSTAANTLATAVAPFNNSLAATVTTTVRGDSVTTLGLETPAGAGIFFGDRNRNGTVAFLSDISPALANIGGGGGKTWEDGDFNGNGTVAFLSDISPALSHIGAAAPPAPTIGAVPEPSSVALVMFGLAAFAAVRRQK